MAGRGGLEGRVAIVTGASAGIGEATARALAGAGLQIAGGLGASGGEIHLEATAGADGALIGSRGRRDVLERHAGAVEDHDLII